MHLTLAEILAAVTVGLTFTQIIKRFAAWPLPRAQLSHLLSKLRQFRSASTDDEKQALSFAMAKHSIVLVGFLAALFVPIVVAIYFLELLFGEKVFSLELGMAMTAASLAFWWITGSWNVANATRLHSYSLASRVLHHLALDFNNVRLATFELEGRHQLSRLHAQRNDRQDVLITGMARSGTSMMLRLLASDNDFSTLRYKNMPFVLAPNIWSSISSSKSKQLHPIERLHKDGLFNDQETPEAFEEVFWETYRTTARKHESFDNEADDEALANYVLYKNIVRSLAEVKPARYLSKNNNSLVRLHGLAADPTNALIVMYRSPLDAAFSMHKTHMKFLDKMSNDRFAKTYLKWLAHYEFGPLHKPFSFATAYMGKTLQPDKIEYWLDYWCAVHEHILSDAPSNILFLSYDKLCADPIDTLRILQERLRFSVQPNDNLMPRHIRAADIFGEFNPNITARAQIIYHELQNDSRNIVSASAKG